MRLLGAIIAGGQSRRFGSDKALALVDGERMVDRVAAALQHQCDALVLCGREETGFVGLPDLPRRGLGPLAGLNAALHHALAEGFDAVLSTGCDVPNLPADLARQLGEAGPAYADVQPVVALYPASLAPQCAAFLLHGGRSLYGFAERVAARPVSVRPALRNINLPTDLAGWHIQ
jgi:molybdopterin-guanine dinucleotide biosynthesis protein A